MARQYKLRLGDGTLLAVDLVGLRAWLHDADARVQRVGSRRWRSLKDMIETETAAAAAKAAAPRPEPPRPPPPVEPSRPAESGAARPGHNVPILPEEGLDEPVPPPLAAASEQEVALPSEQEIAIPVGEEIQVETEEEVAIPDPETEPEPVPVDPVTVARIAAAPPAPVVKPATPVAKPAPTPRPPVAVAPPRPAPAPPPPRAAVMEVVPLAAIDLGDVARSAVTGSFAGFTPTRVARPPGRDEALPIIKLKPLDDEEEEGRLEELDLIEEEPPKIPTLPPLAPIAKTLLDAASAWVARVATPRPPRPEPVLPPPALSELPILRLAPLEDEPARKRGFPKRAILIAATAVAGLAAVATALVWLPSLGLFTRKAPAAVAPVPTPRPPETAPSLPPELQAAAEQLPHLAPETIRLVSSTIEPGPPDPPEVFRHAQLAANRGVSALAPEDALELRSLRSALLGSLRSVDRERVLAYDRVTAGRDLMVGEDARVLRLYARGVRSLSPPRRERLQVLLGKAIASSLVRSAPRATPAVEAR